MLGRIGGFLLSIIVMVIASFGLLLLAPSIPFFGSLPGDFSIMMGETRVFVPLVSCIILSVLVTIVFNVFLSFFRQKA